MTIKKKVTFSALFIGIGGIIAELFPYLMGYDIQKKYIQEIVYLRGLLQLQNFTFFNSRLFYISSNKLIFDLNVLNLTFYSLLIIGTFIFLSSSTKETRLIRFSFSILLFAQIINIVFGTYFFFFWKGNEYTPVLPKTLVSIVIFLFFKLYAFFWIYVCFWILKKLDREIDTFEESYDNIVIEYMVEASKYQRFFHLIIDSIFVILLFSGYLSDFNVAPFGEYYNQELLLWIILIITRFIYYIFYEKTLGATPAKFLTETKVLSENGKKMVSKKVFIRTISRFVPFEPFSFLTYGWHDKWSESTVVREKQIGVTGKNYLWIFPALLVIGLGSYFFADWYKEYLYRKKTQLIYENKISEFQFQLNHLTNNHLIVLKDMNEYKTSTFLKVEEVKPDSIICTVIDLNSESFPNEERGIMKKMPSEPSIVINHRKTEYEDNLSLISELYNDNKDKRLFKQLSISKSLLTKAYTNEFEKSTDFDSYKNKNAYGTELLNDGKMFEINNVVIMYSPILRINGSSSSYGGNFSFGIDNKGWETEMVEIKNLEGDITWTNQLPEKIQAYSSFSISGRNVTGKPYKVQLKLKDLNNKTYTYIAEGDGLELTIKKINP